MNLLKGVKPTGLSSRRAYDEGKIEVSTRPTPGAITFTNEAAKLLGCGERDRVFAFNLPEAFADRPVNFGDALNAFFTAGITSSYDMLRDEYEADNPLNYGAEEDREARKEMRVAYNAEVKEWVLNQIKERGLKNNDSVGNILSDSGNSVGFSSKAPWFALNGTTEGSNVYTPRIVKGIAVLENVCVFVDDDYETTGSELGFIGINPDYTGEDDLLIQVETPADLSTDFMTLTFKEFDTKSERGGDMSPKKEEATDAEGQTIVADDDIDEIV